MRGACLQPFASEATFEDTGRCHPLADSSKCYLIRSATQVKQFIPVLPLVFFYLSARRRTMKSRISSMWRSPPKIDGPPRKDIVMEDITGHGPILLRSNLESNIAHFLCAAVYYKGLVLVEILLD